MIKKRLRQNRVKNSKSKPLSFDVLNGRNTRAQIQYENNTCPSNKIINKEERILLKSTQTGFVKDKELKYNLIKRIL